MKNILGKVVISLCAILSFAGIRSNTAEGYTQELVTNSEIEYPVSLSTGLDKNGREVFPDINFFEYIKKEKYQTGKYSGNEFDLDEDGYLSKEECETVRVLSIAGRTDITSVAGIEAFPKLREFYCNNSGTKELDLSNNPKLQILACSNSDIEILNISSCTLLRELQLSGCALSNIDLTYNGSIEFLTCSEQKRKAGGYLEDGKYLVNLNDLDPEIELAKVSDVKIDGAEGDGISSGYDSSTGVVYCSDEIQMVSYTYNFDFPGSLNDSIDSCLNVTLIIENGYRESFQTDGGRKITAKYYNGVKDAAPKEPVRAGYYFTGWYMDKENTRSYDFGQILDKNIELYAGWEKKTYQVRYKAEGTSLDGKAKSGKVEWWSAGLIPMGNEVPEREGYDLAGWKTESGIVITTSNASVILYKDAALSSEKDYTILEAVWSDKEYRLNLDVSLSESLKKKLEDMPSFYDNRKFTWNSNEILSVISEPYLCGYYITGWYTAKTGGIRITDKTTYGDIYKSQFSEDDPDNIPTIYARFAKRKYTIYYEEQGGTEVTDRQNVVWGSSNLLPEQRTKRKGYKFVGWKYHDKKVTRKTKLNDSQDGFLDYITLTAIWSKVSETEGKTFKRYGCVYKITKSNKKKHWITLIRITTKKITIRNKIYLNGRFFALKGIKKKSLKNAKRVRVKTPTRLSGRFAKMALKAGAKKKTIKIVYTKK